MNGELSDAPLRSAVPLEPAKRKPCMRRRAGIVAMLLALIAGCEGVEQHERAHSQPHQPHPQQEPAVGDALPERTAPAEPRGMLFILHAAHLGDAADAWREYREFDGWNVLIESVTPASVDNHAAFASELQDLIRRAHEVHATLSDLPFAVLLLGDVPEDDTRGIPTWYFEQHDSSLQSWRDDRYATDEPYQFIDDDSRPDIALGRVPARTNDEALLVLEKVRRYEQESPLGPWRRTLAFAAGEGRYGFMDRVLENLFRTMIQRVVPSDVSLSLTYASAASMYCPPPDALTSTVLGQMSSGALLFNYVGHGNARGLDSLYWNDQRFDILERDDLESLSGSGDRLPIGVLTCCSAGWFDLPGGERSLAEAMLFHEAGPVAVIAGSRITHPYANAVFQKDVTALVLAPDVRTVGELDLLAAHSLIAYDTMDEEIDTLAQPVALAMNWPSTLAELRRMHTGLYNLLGDPCTRIARHEASFRSIEISDGRLIASLDRLIEGTAFITIETAAGEPARKSELHGVTGADDVELPAKAAHNYPIANDNALAELQTPISNGRLNVAIDLAPYPDAAAIRVYARGSESDGDAVDASGGVLLTPEGAPSATRRGRR